MSTPVPASATPPGPAPASAPTSGPPPSVTSFRLNLIVLAIVVGCLYLLHQHIIPASAHLDPVSFLAAAVAVPVVIFDILVLKVHLRPSTGMDWDQPFSFDYERVLTKVMGLVVTLLPFAIAYMVFPEYGGPFYDPFYFVLGRYWAWFILAAVIYIVIVDGNMRQPRDAYWQLGRLTLGKLGDVKGKEIANHYRGWLVKAFFFPLMFVWLNGSVHNVVNYDLSTASWSNLRTYQFLYDGVFLVDLLFCTVGYAVCFRPLDSHIRTAEPTFLGWCVALFCYEPFYSGLFERQYTRYGGDGGFESWLAGFPTLRWVWAGTIIALITIYVLASVAFGIRFSNLTHRGVLTNGPYRYCKHPAYVSKNLSWWMAAVPFITHEGWQSAVKHCLALLVLNFMYFMRARTEERHLSWDPTYRTYGTWMNDHGVLRFLNRIPFFRYAPPRKNVIEGPRVESPAPVDPPAPPEPPHDGEEPAGAPT